MASHFSTREPVVLASGGSPAAPVSLPASPMSTGLAPLAHGPTAPLEGEEVGPAKAVRAPERLDLGVGSGSSHTLRTALVDVEAPSAAQPQSAPTAGPPWKKIVFKVCLMVLVFLIASFLLKKYAQDTLTRLANELMTSIGLTGLFLGVFIADGFPQPFTYVPLIFLAVQGHIDKFVVFLICAAASYSAALFGYVTGGCLRRPEWGRKLCQKLTETYPYLEDMMVRRGAIGVLLAAMLPLPLALATWTAGFFNVKFTAFLLAAFGRLPKIIVFVLLSGSPGDNGGGPTA